MDFNNVFLIGRLVRNPEYKVSEKGKAVTKFTLANSGYTKDDTLFIDCICFDKTAEVVRDYCMKGGQLAIQGRLTSSSWQGKDGVTKTKNEILVTQVQFLQKPKEQEQSKPIQQPNPWAHDPKMSDEALESYDDIPF